MAVTPTVSIRLGRWRSNGYALQVEILIGLDPPYWETIMTTSETRRRWNLATHEVAVLLNAKEQE